MRAMPTKTLTVQACGQCGQPLLYLAGLQGGQKLTAEPVDDGQIRVIIEHVNPETPNAPGQDVASYILLPEDVAARARERGERLYGWHVCSQRMEPEEGPVAPWRPYERSLT